jgi:hypothetical protein
MKITPGKRHAVKSRTNGCCYYCGRGDARTLDHLHPASRGGTVRRDNLVAACTKCNSMKGDMTLEELREFTGFQVMWMHSAFGIQVRPVQIKFWGEIHGKQIQA